MNSQKIDVAIVNGRVVNSQSITTADVLISDGRISAIESPGIQQNAGRIIDAAGKFVLPGIIDVRTATLDNPEAPEDDLEEELEEDLGHNEAAIPIEKKGSRVMYCINPREVKYDPRTIKEAALIFWAAGEDWTMPEEGWDNTNFGLFSGDDGLGGALPGSRVGAGSGDFTTGADGRLGHSGRCVLRV